MSNSAADRLRIFLKKAGGPTIVAEKTGLSPATVSNLTRGSSKPSFRVSATIMKTYPALNIRWWFLGGDEPMWLDNPKNVDQDLVNYVEDKKTAYKAQKKLDYSSYTKEQLIELLESKDGVLNDLLTGQNESVYVQKEQLLTLQKILQKIDLQGATTQDTNK